MSPLVSVCIPVAGHARFLGGALDSVRAQAVDDLEVLVCDDASDDDPGAVVRAQGDGRIRLVRRSRSAGVAAARNTCVHHARGRHIAWLDADDVWLPGSLARRLAVLESRPEVAAVHGAPRIVDESGAPLPDWRRPFDRDAIEPSHAAFAQLLHSNELTTSTVVVRGDLQRAVAPFVARGASSSDWEMWLRVALRGDVAYCAEPVADYRRHAATISHAAARSGERLRCDVRVVRRVLHDERARIPRPRALRRSARAALAAKALLHAADLRTRGARPASARAVALAQRLAPSLVGRAGVALARATLGGDDARCHALHQRALGQLAEALDGTRYGAVVSAAATTDPEWQATLGRVARTLRAVTPPDAQVGSVTKWDPTLLALARRRGRQVPDRRLLPAGYPADDVVALEHVERLRGEGLSHLVFPSASFWWLEHYPRLAARLRRNVLHADRDCVIFDLRSAT